MTAEIIPHPAHASSREHFGGCSGQKVRRDRDQCLTLSNWGGEKDRAAKPRLTTGSRRVLQKKKPHKFSSVSA